MEEELRYRGPMMAGPHKVLMADGTWKEVQNIQVGDKLSVHWLVGSFRKDGTAVEAPDRYPICGAGTVKLSSSGEVVRILGRKMPEGGVS